MTVTAAHKRYDPNQPRDKHGRWTSGGGFSAADVWSEEQAAVFDKLMDGYLAGLPVISQTIFDDRLEDLGQPENRRAAKQQIEEELGELLRQRLINKYGLNGDEVELPDGRFFSPDRAAEFVASTVNGWAQTSYDDSENAHTMQNAAEAEFGLTGSWKRPANGMYTAPSMAERELLRAMYDHTQKWFAEQGITHVTLYRGENNWKRYGVDPPGAFDGGWLENPRVKPVTAQMQPMSSWSLHVNTAKEFAVPYDAGLLDGGVILVAKVPVERIIATPRTGYGCLNETEVVVLGGAIEAGAMQALDLMSFTNPEYQDAYDWMRENVVPWQDDNAGGMLSDTARTLNYLFTGERMSPIEAELTALLTAALAQRYNPNQPRDKYGRWTSGGGGGWSGDPKELFTEELEAARLAVRKGLVDGLPVGVPDIPGLLENEKNFGGVFRFLVENEDNRQFAKEELTKNLTDAVFEQNIEGFTGRLPKELYAQEVELQVRGWAGTSYDHDPRAATAQDSAEEEFNIKGAWKREDMLMGSDPFVQAMQRAMYDQTQRWFAERGITEITVFRGEGNSSRYDTGTHQGLYAGSRAVEYGLNTARMQPMSSWSLSLRESMEFAPDYDSVILTTKVPVERVLATPRTGYGCLHEEEVVILGGEIDVVAFPSRQLDRYDDLNFADMAEIFNTSLELGGPTGQRSEQRYNPNQPRDKDGKWTSGGSGWSGLPDREGLLAGIGGDALKFLTDPAARALLGEHIVGPNGDMLRPAVTEAMRGVMANLGIPLRDDVAIRPEKFGPDRTTIVAMAGQDGVIHLNQERFARMSMAGQHEDIALVLAHEHLHLRAAKGQPRYTAIDAGTIGYEEGAVESLTRELADRAGIMTVKTTAGYDGFVRAYEKLETRLGVEPGTLVMDVLKRPGKAREALYGALQEHGLDVTAKRYTNLQTPQEKALDEMFSLSRSDELGNDHLDELLNQIFPEARSLEGRYNPNQPRDKDGKWTSGGGGGALSSARIGELLDSDFSEVTDDEMSAAYEQWVDDAFNNGVEGIEAINHYTSGGMSGPVNQLLRNGWDGSYDEDAEDPYEAFDEWLDGSNAEILIDTYGDPFTAADYIRAEIDAIDETLRLGSLDRNVMLYRGGRVPGFDPDNPDALVGKAFRDPGFVSTSVDKGVANSFAKGYMNSMKSPDRIIMEISAPEGTPGGYLPALNSGGHYDFEQEFLLPRDTTFLVTGWRSDSRLDSVVVEMMVVPDAS